MALITKLAPMTKDVRRVHDAVECGHTSFERGGQKYLRLDSPYGSDVAVSAPGR